ncbi:MAG TPA: hypothetical protein VF281_02695 [Candidatus Saccharimonadales bacterium]
MQKIKNAVRMCLIYVSMVVLASGYPMAAFAETADGTPVPETAPTAPAAPPAPERVYNYNPDTRRWDSDKWVFNPSTGRYEAVPQPVATPPTPAATDITPQTTTTSNDPSTSSTDINANTNATIDNEIVSNATTGNATVGSNTTGGSATTGDAAAVATIMNTINSSVNAGGPEFATFVADIVGDVHGDIMLYPMLLKAMLQAATQPTDASITANTSATINNDVTLNATSGDAAVTQNTNAGNATSGSANTVANVMNIINSIIAANQSFVGTVNIYGNLDGDILVAPDFLPQLLASNNGSTSSPNSSLVVSSDDTQAIVNNINLSALTGDATVAGNTNAGSATTGQAKTNVVLLNLSGHQIVASNSLLVFVNVLGQWVGMIVDAPAGATAAALGNGVTSNSITPDLTITANNESTITNNINLTSQSGDATVSQNTNAGNATTGNATASANIANVSNTQMGLSGWFGLVMINVFGNWFGSFGVDTNAGNQPAPTQTTSPPTAQQPPQVFQFVEKAAATATRSLPTLTASLAEPPVEETAAEQPEVLSALTTVTPPSSPTPTETSGGIDFLPFVIAAFVISLIGAAARTLVLVVRNRQSLA